MLFIDHDKLLLYARSTNSLSRSSMHQEDYELTNIESYLSFADIHAGGSLKVKVKV